MTSSTKRDLRIAHASDIHLDTDYFGDPDHLPQRDHCRRIFEDLLAAITAAKPDLMLLPGDLFDSNRATEETIVWSMEKLGDLPFPVILIPGNHDCMEEGAIFTRHDFSGIPNVDILLAEEGETLDLPDLQARIWGKGMVEHSVEFRPLDGLPAATPERWNLAMGHGIYVGRDGFSFRSSPVESKQISKSGYDYIALGHHHALLDVSANGTAAAYSGAPTPISREHHGTWILVELGEGREAQMTIRELG